MLDTIKNQRMTMGFNVRHTQFIRLACGRLFQSLQLNLKRTENVIMLLYILIKSPYKIIQISLSLLVL